MMGKMENTLLHQQNFEINQIVASSQSVENDFSVLIRDIVENSNSDWNKHLKDNTNTLDHFTS
jgi:hypothetical protein